jgi:hypothetical protein
MKESDRVERPHLAWWIAIVGGLTVLALQGFSTSFYAWWTASVNALPAQATMAWIFLACIPIHIGEALYVFWQSNRIGTPQASIGWALQTFFIGLPSTLLMIKRARAHHRDVAAHPRTAPSH